MIRFKPYAVTLLTICGLILIGMGLYFALIRPELLSEDIRYMGASSEATPGLLNWLDKVFWVMGGYVFTTGLLTCYVAQTSFQKREQGALTVMTIAGISSIGLMVMINFLIGSDFKWVLFVVAVLWLSALGLFVQQN
jgi:hypothetical protein